MKYLAIDLGEKRIGLAVSDQKGLVAAPFHTIERTSETDIVEDISHICEEKKIEVIVLGVPYSASDKVQKKFRFLGKQINEKTDIPVKEWDETFSTKQAQNMVAFSDPGPGKKESKSHKDKVAAAVILQEFLDYENSH